MREWLVLSLVCYTHSLASYSLRPIKSSHGGAFLYTDTPYSKAFRIRPFQQSFLLSSSNAIESSSSSSHLEDKDKNRAEGPEYAFLSSLDESIYGTAFVQRLHDLQVFKDKYGHCRVPKRYAPNKTLGWDSLHYYVHSWLWRMQIYHFSVFWS